MALEIHIPSAESSLLNDNDYNFHAATSNDISSQNTGQKRTRQWAAWTRQEQENFFTALRQVGKNFEKITCRVQSKNKNQVRYYYYRLVRRMNKLLSPGVCLDAKNSKDTNSAMLRWWSLVEKYSCTPAKLHRKPRRFKIFIEALENQLLKDRNKARRKRQYQGENCLETSSASSFLRRFSDQDFVGVKAIVTDVENTAKLGIIRGPSMKRNSNSNANFNKGVFSAMKASGHRHRTGLVESAAYKRWEKAAMAGVSLVADAAEQLERVANARVYSIGIGEAIREKLKLQLFPIDEDTRQRLEKGEHNPFLELTLSARKRMSSVLEHLNRKWGANTIDSSELLLLPYNVPLDEMIKCQRWTIKDADSTAADVHIALGKPSIFRLRYGWFSGDELRARFSNSPLAVTSNVLSNTEDNAKRFIISYTSDANPSLCCEPMLLGARTRAPTSTLKSNDHFLETSDKSVLIAEKIKECSSNQQEDIANPAIRPSSELLAGEWADSLTDISVGDLLLEASDVSSQQNALSIQQTSYSCDSFDAAVAANNYFPQFTGLQTQPSSVTSIWNADETCDGFSFHSSPAVREKGSNPSPAQLVFKEKANTTNSSVLIGCFIKDLKEPEPSDDNPCVAPESENLSDFSYKQEPAKDASLTDMYWPDSLDSLGHLDLDIPFSKYQGQDLCFTESISQSSFSRMIAGCLDAFQSGSQHLESTGKKEISDASGDEVSPQDKDP